MANICPECGGETLDPAFCDLCNADLSAPAAVVPESCPLLPAGEKLSARQRQRLARPDAAVVISADDGQVWRLHWLGRADFPRWFPIIEDRGRRALDILPVCRQIDEPQGLWLAAPCRGRPAQPWWTDRARDPLEEVRRLFDFVRPLAHTLTLLHEQGLIWLNFDPEEIEEVASDPADGQGEVRLYPSNLDLQVFRAGQFPERLVISPAFTAPEIGLGQPERIGPATDVFHLGVFCYYWLARLLPDGFPGAGLHSFAYHMPPLRIFAHDVPPGLAAFLDRAVAEDPQQRPPTPAAFVTELSQLLRDIECRWASASSAGTWPGSGTPGPGGPAVDAPPNAPASGPELLWEIGAHTRIGRSKAALGGANEDGVLVKDFADPRRALIAVADGISICDVGNGSLARSITLAVLERIFDPAGLGQDDFVRLIVQTSQEASRSMIAWAVENGHEQALRDEKNLMGTTLCAGWLQGNCLTVANLGDSRTYLATADAIEQLTVDGDMATALLSEGTPPERVREVGSLGKALRDCVGGCQIGPDGDLQPWTESLPTLTRLPLLAGDVIVLCSDGLVEEGAFLSPESLLRLIQQHRSLPAAQLAELLADEADALQRLPSALEPEGFGDNISCIVVKVLGN